MSEEIKNVNAKIDEAEKAVKKYASKDTVISIGGYEFTPAKLMVAFTLVSSLLGGLYGAFEVYKDYQGMKDKIAKYVSPDLTEIYKKMEVLDANTSKMTEYTNNIKNDLKDDVRRVESVVESMERSTKSAQRDTDASIKEIKKESDATLKEVRRYSDQSVKEVTQELVKNQKETTAEIRALRNEVDMKIKKALDNPLSN
jgi:membrane-associated HD superfamily phosphohydrolase